MFMLSDCVSVLLLHNADTAVNVRKNAKLIKSGWHSDVEILSFYFVPSKMSSQKEKQSVKLHLPPEAHPISQWHDDFYQHIALLDIWNTLVYWLAQTLSSCYRVLLEDSKLAPAK